MSEPDPLTRLRLTVQLTAGWAEAAADLIDIVRAEAASAPDVAAAWKEAETSRLHGNAAVITTLHEGGHLLPELSLEQATDLMWTLEATDLYRLLVTERGWSIDAYIDHLTRLLAQSLLA